ncbi:MAG: C26 family cysteine hydrolase domain-containing family [Bacilli bacterium]|nr:C26 family cysteine hydrolase domain-containing family [Bacilli bacterium]
MKCIAVTQRVEYIEGIGERRDALSQEWAVLAEECGFLPLLLPNRLPTVVQMLDRWAPDGILLTGGNDLAAYGGDAPERDETEQFLIQYAIDHSVPLLGVCRGIQILLDYFGTPLQKVEGHIRVEHALSNGDTVNSFHSWGAVSCKESIIPVVHSADGVLEAVKVRDYPWICGMMWHPERYHPPRERDVQLIKEVFGL